MPQPTPASPQHIYLEVHAGYAMRNWQDFSNFKDIYAPTGANTDTINSYLTGASFTHGKGGLSWGVTAGYEFNSVLSVEGFYSMLSNTGWSNSLTTPGAQTTTINGTIQTWIAGAAIKLAATITPSTALYIKAGPAYINDKVDYKIIVSGGGATTSYSCTDDRIGLYAAAGADFSIDNGMYVGLQYSYIAGNSEAPSSTKDFRSPNIHMIMANIGVKFST